MQAAELLDEWDHEPTRPDLIAQWPAALQALVRGVSEDELLAVLHEHRMDDTR